MKNLKVRQKKGKDGAVGNTHTWITHSRMSQSDDTRGPNHHSVSPATELNEFCRLVVKSASRWIFSWSQGNNRCQAKLSGIYRPPPSGAAELLFWRKTVFKLRREPIKWTKTPGMCVFFHSGRGNSSASCWKRCSSQTAQRASGRAASSPQRGGFVFCLSLKDLNEIRQKIGLWNNKEK